MYYLNILIMNIIKNMINFIFLNKSLTHIGVLTQQFFFIKKMVQPILGLKKKKAQLNNLLHLLKQK